MSQTVAEPVVPSGDELPLAAGAPRYPGLMRELLRLALPVLAEHLLHIVVALTDTYLANHLPTRAAEATAAIGNVGYIFWFIGLFAGAIGTGSTAIISREVGARHRRRANSACGQSMLFAAMVGIGLGVVLFVFADGVAALMGLSGAAHDYALSYLRMLCAAVPFVVVMFVANACLRGAGDTLTPALAMIVVDVVNVVLSCGLTWGLFGLPAMGFTGIAIGTLVAYVAGGTLQVVVLIVGRGGIRLHLHRLRPHWRDMKRILRIGVPSGLTDAVNWIANFALIRIVNRTEPLNVAAAAHINAVRIESLSYMAGFAISIAVATMVGQSLGMKDPRRAGRSAYYGYLLGGGFMTFVGVLFIFFAHVPTRWMVEDPQVRDLTVRCLQITGFCQAGFAAAIIFGGALRGAGDTLAVMLITMISILILRLGGVMFVGGYLKQPLPIIWVILATDLFLRGMLVYGRFLHGGWKRVKV
ncbi:MAG TPA: MATE family efflux transporter [Tepidisphaeraceae bacterium]|nr:MATE family efflux transporter [Tepidisphaeraceae bacterium]